VHTREDRDEGFDEVMSKEQSFDFWKDKELSDQVAAGAATEEDVGGEGGHDDGGGGGKGGRGRGRGKGRGKR
jgi:hypothetical protein